MALSKRHGFHRLGCSITEGTAVPVCSPGDISDDEYAMGWDITTVFHISTNGFKTHRDHFLITFDKQELEGSINKLLRSNMSVRELAETFDLSDTRDWSLARAVSQLRALDDPSDKIVRCLFRPLDYRFTYYGPELMDWPRIKTGHHALKPNICLAVGRQGLAVGRETWNLVTVGDAVADTNLFRRGGIQYFPIFTYPEENQAEGTHLGKQCNLTKEFIAEFSLKSKMKFVLDDRGDCIKTFGPEDGFNYIYVILHSPTYRTRYAQFLKSDFPRIPLTSNRILLRALCEKGRELADFHLMRRFGRSMTTFPVANGSIVENVRYEEPSGKTHGRVWINKAQYFEGISSEIWNFHIGGYQVSEKWLKDREGRVLGYDEIRHYERIVAALFETIQLIAEIDATINAAGGWPIK